MIRVLVVDDSAFSRKVITKILEGLPDIEIADTASDGQDALKKTIRLRPDLITLDLAMPNMDGFTFLRWIMSTMPTPVIVISAREADENVFKALDLGALDFVSKPTDVPSGELENIKADLIEKVLSIPLLRSKKTKEKLEVEERLTKEQLKKGKPAEKPRLIGLAASTGGPPAIQRIVQDLPSGFDVPLVIAQHMPPTFTALFAERLNRNTTLQVQEAVDGALLESGHVYIAPGGKTLRVKKTMGQLKLQISEEPGERYFPSGDLLFESIATGAEGRTVGVVLTGMGDDGCLGLKKIKEQGGITIAESERTATIFGMPQEAVRAGVVDYVLPLHQIAYAFTIFCGTV